MKKPLLCLYLAVSLLLSGCRIMNGTYVSVTPHREHRQTTQAEILSADNYLDLMTALTDMIHSGTASATINLAHYPATAVDSGMSVAMRYAMENDPIGAFAVDNITYEVGYSGGQPAVAIQISYLRNRLELRQISRLSNMEQAGIAVREALEKHEPGVVMLVEEYTPTDFPQLVLDISQASPHLVMESPQVTPGIYGNGKQRVIELIFTYQNSRDALRQMQNQVHPIFESAALYVSGDSSQWQKYAQLYGFLMERFDYTIETSITPAYSLLCHGVGDSRTFAMVYAAMCQAADLNCQIITGTRAGVPWTWNLVEDSGYFYHVDLLRCSEAGQFMEKTDLQMQGYVWDYSAYPASTGPAPLEDPPSQEQATPSQSDNDASDSGNS